MIPEFVSKIASQEDWIEAHDAIFDSATGIQLTGYNAEIWFSTNVKIRKTILRLKASIQEVTLHDKPPLRINFRLLVRESGVTYKSLSHPLRVYWVKAEVASIKKVLMKGGENHLRRHERNITRIEQLELTEKSLRGQLLKEVVIGREKDQEIQKLEKIISLLNRKLSGLES